MACQKKEKKGGGWVQLGLQKIQWKRKKWFEMRGTVKKKREWKKKRKLGESRTHQIHLLYQCTAEYAVSLAIARFYLGLGCTTSFSPRLACTFSSPFSKKLKKKKLNKFSQVSSKTFRLQPCALYFLEEKKAAGLGVGLGACCCC